MAAAMLYVTYHVLTLNCQPHCRVMAGCTPYYKKVPYSMGVFVFIPYIKYGAQGINNAAYANVYGYLVGQRVKKLTAPCKHYPAHKNVNNG